MRFREAYRWVRAALMGHRVKYLVTRYEHDYWRAEFVIRERLVMCRWCPLQLGIETDGRMTWES